MSRWFDAHNHLQDPRLSDTARIVDTMRKSGIGGCVVNATREEDWGAVAKLAVSYPDFVIPAFGIHPWHAASATVGWIDRLRGLLDKFPQASIGECGLDKWVVDPPLETQLAVFLPQLALARNMNRPATIHCLKAWGPLMEAFATCPPPYRFLMHSFSGSIEIARQLEKGGGYFSFSGHFLHPRKEAIREIFRQLPLERILLETDGPDMIPPAEWISHPLSELINHPANLPAIGAALEEILGERQLAEITTANASRLFRIDRAS